MIKSTLMAARNNTLAGKIRNLPGIIAYWPLTEKTGVTADNAQGAATYDGTYTNSPILANVTFPVGNNVVNIITAGSSYVDLPVNDFHAAVDWSKGWLIGWGKPDAAIQTDSTRHTWFQLKRNDEEQLYIMKDTLNYQYEFRFRSGGVNRNMEWHKVNPVWTMLGMVWDYDSDYVTPYIDGVAYEGLTGLGAFSGNATLLPNALIGWAYSSFSGGIGHIAFGAGVTITEAQINDIYHSIIGPTEEIHFSGDSKANYEDEWPMFLINSLGTATGDTWRERPGRIGLEGGGVIELHNYVDANLDLLLGGPSLITINIGVNDLPGITEADYKTNLIGVIDKYRSRWPNANIYVAQPWKQGQNAAAANMKTWILAVIATYETNVFAGPDETTWLENGDDGATYTLGGVHYNPAGMIECALQWLTAIGY